MPVFKANIRGFNLCAKSLKLHTLYFAAGTYTYRTVEMLHMTNSTVFIPHLDPCTFY